MLTDPESKKEAPPATYTYVATAEEMALPPEEQAERIMDNMLGMHGEQTEENTYAFVVHYRVQSDFFRLDEGIAYPPHWVSTGRGCL